MIKVSNIETFNWDGAMRGARNPLESWSKSDSHWCNITQPHDIDMCNNCTCANYCQDVDNYVIGTEDLKLAQKLVQAGSDERKFLRQIFVSMDIESPIYWWKEMDTYKVATVANSTSTMHKLMSRPITIDDFSTDHMDDIALSAFKQYVDYIESLRKIYVEGFGQYEPHDKRIWYSIIQMLPSSYNQTRTWTANYEILRNIYHARKNHRLQEWREFCAMIEELPYAQELICTNCTNKLGGN